MHAKVMISISDMSAEDWVPEFEARLRGFLEDSFLEISIPKPIGGFGAGKKQKAEVRRKQDDLIKNTKALNRNTIAATLGVIVTTVVLIMQASSYVPETSTQEIVCVIKGEWGEARMTVNADKEVMTKAISDCMENLGIPQELNFVEK